MVRVRFIWCRKCDEIHHVTPFDKAPLYSVISGEVRETITDDWRAFMEKHAGHTLEPLETLGTAHFPTGSVADPMNTGYISVSNGRDRFILRRTRNSIREPLSFELIRGRFNSMGIALEAQGNEIKKEMKYHFSWAPGLPLQDEKIDLFIELFREVIKEIDPDELRVSEYSRIQDDVAYGVLDGRSVEKLMTKCALYYFPAELEAIRRFINSHRERCDVMTVVMRRQLAIEQPSS